MKPLWWQPPQLRIDRNGETERHATWLELFYDLVFVVTITQLSHTLSANISLSGVLSFVALFVPVWWAWIGATFYAARFDTDDVGHRLLTLFQMMAIVALASNIERGFGDGSAGLALAYAAIRGGIILSYFRACLHVRIARPLIRRYVVGFAIAASCWSISAFVPVPFRFGLWGVGTIVDFATPISAGKLHSKLTPHPAHLSERFGLFTIIVLGESILAVVNGLSQQQWQLASAIAGILGLMIAFSLGWLYFDNLSSRAIKAAHTAGQVGIYQIWLYTHLPLVISITAIGVGVKHVISSNPELALPTGERWLICGAVALCFLTLGILQCTDTIPSRKRRARHRLIGVLIAGTLAIVGQGLLPIAAIGAIAMLGIVQIVLDLSQTQEVAGI